MSAIVSVSLEARAIHRSHQPGNEEMILMGPGVYIHEMTPAMAKQWIRVLETIAKEA